MEQHRPIPSFCGLSSTSLESAKVIIVPLPVENTTTYRKGTKEGPQAILFSSYNLELYDEELEDIPADVGIYTHPDLGLPIGDIYKTISKIEEFTYKTLNLKKFPIFLGGEHTVTKGIVRGYIDYFGQNFSILHLDAHSDLKKEYEGTEYSHACALREAAERLNLVQVGIRSLSYEEREFIDLNSINVFWDIQINGDKSLWINKVLESLKDKVYITLDFDVFNPSEMPAVGTPEPGGLLWYDIITLLKEVFKEKQILGIDLVELSPIPGFIPPDYLAAKLVYKVIGYCKKYQ